MSSLLASTVACRHCGRSETSAQAFLLTCRTCHKTWHHSCYQPMVTEEELMKRLAASHDLRGFHSLEGITGWICKRCKNHALNHPKPPLKNSGDLDDPICVDSDDEKEQAQSSLPRSRAISSQQTLASGIEVISLDDDEEDASANVVQTTPGSSRPQNLPSAVVPESVPSFNHGVQVARPQDPVPPQVSSPPASRSSPFPQISLSPTDPSTSSLHGTSQGLHMVAPPSKVVRAPETRLTSGSPPVTDSRTASTDISRYVTPGSEIHGEIQPTFVDYSDMDRLAEGAEIMIMSSSESEADDEEPHEPEPYYSRPLSRTYSPSTGSRVDHRDDLPLRASSIAEPEGPMERDAESVEEEDFQLAEVPILPEVASSPARGRLLRAHSGSPRPSQEDVDMDEIDQLLSSDYDDANQSIGRATASSRMHTSEAGSESRRTPFTLERETEEEISQRLAWARQEALTLILGHVPPLARKKDVPEPPDLSRLSLLHMSIDPGNLGSRPPSFWQYTQYNSTQRRKLVKPRSKATLLGPGYPGTEEGQRETARAGLSPEHRHHQHHSRASASQGPGALQANDTGPASPLCMRWDDSISRYRPPRPPRKGRRSFKLEPPSEIDVKRLERESERSYEPSERSSYVSSSTISQHHSTRSGRKS